MSPLPPPASGGRPAPPGTAGPGPLSASVSRHRFFWALIAVGFLSRLLLAAISLGSNDILSWYYFGGSIASHGVGAAYETLNTRALLFNYPPLTGYFAQGVYLLAGGQMRLFALFFKLPGIAAEAAGAYLLYRHVLGRLGPLEASKRAAAFSLSLVSILISGYHGNTDPIYCFFAFASVVFWEDERPFLSGLSLAAAINVKLIPLMIVPVMLSQARSKASLARFVAGLSCAAIPFLPFMPSHGAAILDNVFLYKGYPDNWGFSFLFKSPAYFTWARGLILLLITALCGLARMRRRGTAGELASTSCVLFLVFTPAFGIQYALCPLPLLFLGSRRLAGGYALLSGIFASSLYAHWWTGGFPLASWFATAMPPPQVALGFAVWLYLLVFLYRLTCTTLAGGKPLK
ncbi:MAG: DUF2029 domain-containing protein [Elusimicrobia bacterium]|nr:DUF2029 domain-containing protein [Elusimicrobiota bacterium]